MTSTTPPARNRELLVHRYAELRDAGQGGGVEGRRIKAAVLIAYRAELRKFARNWVRRLPASAPFDVDDLIQEGAIVALAALEHADATRAFEGLLKSSLRNRFRDVRRNEGRRPNAVECVDNYRVHARIDGVCMQSVTYAPAPDSAGA